MQCYFSFMKYVSMCSLVYPFEKIIEIIATSFPSRILASNFKIIFKTIFSVRALANRKFDDKRDAATKRRFKNDVLDDDDVYFDDDDDDLNLASISISGLPQNPTSAFPLVQKRENQFY